MIWDSLSSFQKLKIWKVSKFYILSFGFHFWYWNYIYIMAQSLSHVGTCSEFLRMRL